MAPPTPSPTASHRASARPAWPRWLVVGIAGWAGLAWLGTRLYGFAPPRAGFDLELLLAAGRRVAAGGTPYDAAILGGQSPTAVDLFYSYPPPVAQYLSLFAAIPSSVMLVAWGVAAALGLVAVGVALGRPVRGARASRFPGRLRTVGLPVAAVAPLVFPFAIAILFGNLDALFPLLYGLMLLGALVPTLPARFAGGSALAIASVAKLHPASMGLWFLVRGVRERRLAAPAIRGAGPAGVPGAWLVAAAAVATGIVILVLSLLAGGLTPWTDYVAVLRAGAAAAVVDTRNAGPAAQVALLLGGGEALARLLQVGVTLAAAGVTLAAAWRCRDTLESFTWAAVASLVILPVTWFHYPVAILPVALVAWLRAAPAQRRRVQALLAGALVVSAVAAALPVIVWIAVALVLLAARASRPTDDPAPTVAGRAGSVVPSAGVAAGDGVAAGAGVAA